MESRELVFRIDRPGKGENQEPLAAPKSLLPASRIAVKYLISRDYFRPSRDAELQKLPQRPPKEAHSSALSPLSLPVDSGKNCH